MKSARLPLQPSTFLWVAAVALGYPGSLCSQSNGVWAVPGGGSWLVPANWIGGVQANGTDAEADFSTRNITATRTITLDGPRTIGTLRFGDGPSTPADITHDQTLSAGTGDPLTMDTSIGKALIENRNRTTTLGVVLAGDDGISITNGTGTGGSVILTAANTFTGGLNIAGAVVQLNHSGAVNTGRKSNPITLLPATPPTRLLINGGVRIDSTIHVPFDVTGVSGTGMLQQTGTGQATLSGLVTIHGSASGGGHFAGGSTAANALVIDGPITASVNLVHRDGVVRYGGTGSHYNLLLVSHTALLGARDGISTAATVHLGRASNGILDLNGFDQTLDGLALGYNITPTAFTGTVNLGDRTLTLNGDLLTSGSSTASHLINASGGGSLEVGGTGRNLIVADSSVAEDLIINQAALNGAGGFFKAGHGILSLNGTTGSAPFFLGAGGLSIGRLGAAGTFSLPFLGMAGFTRLYVDAGPGGDLANAGFLSTEGTTSLIINQLGGALPPGIYPFLNYEGASPGLAGFSLEPIGHSTAYLVDTGKTIALQVTANQAITWDGTVSNDWSTVPQGNWKLASGPADYIESDDVIFPDTPTSSSVVLSQHVYPSRVTLQNDTPVDYTITSAGAYGIGGGASLIKNGTGQTTLRSSHSYLGATIVRGGTLELDHDTADNSVLTGTSGVQLAAGTQLQLTRDDGNITFTRPLAGSGLLQINPHTSTAGVSARSVVLPAASPGFSGPIQLMSPLNGTWRLQSPQPGALGSGPLEVQSGVQLYTNAGSIYPNPIMISGTGYADSGGRIGALRLDSGSTWSGSITVTAEGARIGVHNSTATISGNISGGDLNVNGTNGSYNNSCTLIFTGSNTYGRTTIGGGSTASGASNRRLFIGNGGTTGTLGKGIVEITGDAQNGILGFDRLDGYSLAEGQTITAVGAQPVRTFIDVDTRGKGLDQRGQAIRLGAASQTGGGQIRISQARSGSLLTTDNIVTAGQIRVSTGAPDGALNIGPGSVINTNQLFLGESNNSSATAHQAAGSSVNVAGQFRVGHFGTETSVYSMNGGTLTLTGASPALSPSTAGSGAAGTAGDNNINALAVPAIVGGGIYLGIDGTGVFHQNGGTVTTNWIVLDNRGNTGPAANMPTGVDGYNLNGGTLSLRSTWGIVQRNPSAGFNLAGGTIQVENSGSGHGTGANLTIPLSTNITVSGSGSRLDTNGPGNAFSLDRHVTGKGTLALAGGGTIHLTPAAVQIITPDLSGNATLQKEGAGTSAMLGSAAAFTGAVIVKAGRLDLPADTRPEFITLEAGAALSAEVTTGSLVLNGGTLLFDPASPSVLTTGSLSVNGTILLDFSKAPPRDGTFSLLGYSSKSGTGTFLFAGAAAYRNISLKDTGSQILVTLSGTRQLTWQGNTDGGNVWGLASSGLWRNAAPAVDSFFHGDSVLFDDTGSHMDVMIAGGAAPQATLVNSTSNNFTFISSGTGIGGGGPLIKEGSGVLTLTGANNYSGRTEVKGGTLVWTTPSSLGSGLPGNSILLQGGGRLSYRGTESVDSGINRDILTGPGGGSLSHENPAAASLTISGRLLGSAPLTFRSGLAGTGTFILSGDNSGFTGSFFVDAPAAGAGGLTVLRPANQGAVPLSGSITLNYPAGGSAGNATTLDLPDVTIPSGVSLHLTSLQTSHNLRTQVTSTGRSTVNGSVTLTGSGNIQFSPANGTMTLNGSISDGASPFTSSLLLRGGVSGTGFLHGKVNLPSGGIAKTDPGTWWIDTSGHRWARTDILSGGLIMGTANALAVSAPLTLGQDDPAAATLNLNGFSQAVGNLASNPPTPGPNNIGKSIISNTPAVLTVMQSVDGTYAGLIGGMVSLVKSGTAALHLAAGNSYSGPTIIQGGTLFIRNPDGTSATGTGEVTVKAGGTLAGPGSISGPLSLERDGTLSPGQGAGILTTGPITLAGRSLLVWDFTHGNALPGTGHDLVRAESLALTATAAQPVMIRINPSGPGHFRGTPGSFTLLKTTSGITGFDATAFALDATGFGAGGGTWSISQGGKDLLLHYLPADFEAWAVSHQLDGDSAAWDDDPDKDTLNNLGEFALNSGPTSAAGSGKVQAFAVHHAGLNYFCLTLPVRDVIIFSGFPGQSGSGSGVIYHIEGSEDLQLWDTPLAELIPAVTTGLPGLDAGWSYRSFRTSTPVFPGERKFLRARMTVSP